MKKLPRQTLLIKNKKGKLTEAIRKPYSGCYRTNRYFDMVKRDFRILNKPFTPILVPVK